MRKLAFGLAALAAPSAIANAASYDVRIADYRYEWGYVQNGFTVNPYNGDIWPQYQLAP